MMPFFAPANIISRVSPKGPSHKVIEGTNPSKAHSLRQESSGPSFAAYPHTFACNVPIFEFRNPGGCHTRTSK